MIPRSVLHVLVLFAFWASVSAQEPFEGETLISPINSHNTHLIDMDGAVTETWHGSDRPASIAYLLFDGSILRPCQVNDGYFDVGGSGGRIQRIDAHDNLVWDFYFTGAERKQHHDIEPMPNGNILLIAWEAKTQQEAIAAGRQAIGGEMWPTLIVEVEPVGSTGGNIVWEWHLWDRLIQDADPAKDNYGVVADHPELIDVNYGNVGGPGGSGDWVHANAIDYHLEFDQIVFSSRTLDELYVIDHSTTTEEAAGHTGGNSGMGGDILYRWGNPQVYDRGSSPDRIFYVVHGVNWIDPGLPGEGNILAFNNGDRPGVLNDYSTVYEIVPPVDGYGNYSIEPGTAFGPYTPVWMYGEPGEFYAGASQCGAFRLPNGNTLACAAQSGYLFEVTELGTTVWDYSHPTGNIARAQRYWNDTGVPSDDDALPPGSVALSAGVPNPFAASTSLSFIIPEAGRVMIEIVSVTGRRVAVLVDGHYGAGEFDATWDGRDVNGQKAASGIYFARMEAGGTVAVRKVVLLE